MPPTLRDVHLTLGFHSGTLTIEGDGAPEALHEVATLDPRDGRYRAPADAYRRVFAALHRAQVADELTFEDDARAYVPLGLQPRGRRQPRDYQREAIEAWVAAGKRGLVVLPTGAGKSFVAHLAIALGRWQRQGCERQLGQLTIWGHEQVPHAFATQGPVEHAAEHRPLEPPPCLDH